MKKLDDASWHLDNEEFREGLPEENAATHIGFFVAWAINKGLWWVFRTNVTADFGIVTEDFGPS